MRKMNPNSNLLALFLLLAHMALSSLAYPYIDDLDEGRLVERKDRLVKLIMQQSCWYQEYNKRLTCKCDSTDTQAKLYLRMKYYVFKRGNEIRSVHLEQCKALLVELDLRDVDATNFPIHFRAITKVEVERIAFEPKYSDRQELQLVFNNVEQVLFQNLFVEDTLKLKATNVKEINLIGSTFAHIPRRGFDISRARILDIRDSSFLRISPQSVIVEKTTKVVVLKNEMAINALVAVQAKDGSYLMISCNRLLDQPVSPECSKTTTTTTTTTTTPIPFLINQGNLRENSGTNEGGQQNGGGGLESFLPELIGGVVAGIVVITALILLFICVMKRGRKEEGQGQQPAVVCVEAPKEEAEEKESPKKEVPEESDLLLGPEDAAANVDEDEGPRFVSPVWLEEIQKNRIFNKQKSLLSEEGLKDIAEGKKEQSSPILEDGDKEKSTKEEENLEMPVINGGQGDEHAIMEETTASITPKPDTPHHESEIKESSRTESDEEFHNSHQQGVDHNQDSLQQQPCSKVKRQAPKPPPRPSSVSPTNTSPAHPPKSPVEVFQGNKENGDEAIEEEEEEGEAEDVPVGDGVSGGGGDESLEALLQKVKDQEVALLEESNEI